MVRPVQVTAQQVMLDTRSIRSLLLVSERAQHPCQRSPDAVPDCGAGDADGEVLPDTDRAPPGAMEQQRASGYQQDHQSATREDGGQGAGDYLTQYVAHHCARLPSRYCIFVTASWPVKQGDSIAASQAEAQPIAARGEVAPSPGPPRQRWHPEAAGVPPHRLVDSA